MLNRLLNYFNSGSNKSLVITTEYVPISKQNHADVSISTNDMKNLLFGLQRIQQGLLCAAS